MIRRKVDVYAHRVSNSIIHVLPSNVEKEEPIGQFDPSLMSRASSVHVRVGTALAKQKIRMNGTGSIAYCVASLEANYVFGAPGRHVVLLFKIEAIV